MAWTKAKTAIVFGAAVIWAVGTTTVVVNKARAETQTQDQTLTLKVNPNLFIANIKAQANETMNTASNHWSDVLVDMLRIQGFFPLPSRDIEFNTEVGEITTRNTPSALEKFRRTIDELNQPNGKCSYFSRVPLQQEILFTALLYKVRSSDFDRLGLGEPTVKETRDRSGWWALDPKRLNEIKDNLQTLGTKPFSSPRIDTGYGVAADVNVGEPAKNIELECLPISPVENPDGKKQIVDFKIMARTSGIFTSNSTGDWGDFADRTNCALFAEAQIEDGSALAFRANNSGDNDLIILLGVNIEAKK